MIIKCHVSPHHNQVKMSHMSSIWYNAADLTGILWMRREYKSYLTCEIDDMSAKNGCRVSRDMIIYKYPRFRWFNKVTKITAMITIKTSNSTATTTATTGYFWIHSVDYLKKQRAQYKVQEKEGSSARSIIKRDHALGTYSINPGKRIFSLFFIVKINFNDNIFGDEGRLFLLIW